MVWKSATVSPVKKLLDDPVAFMNRNLIVVNFEGSPRDTPDEPLELVLYTRPISEYVGKKFAATLPVYFLAHPSVLAFQQNSAQVGEKFTAYFCPYRQNDTLGTVISHKADLMFTAAMDGCSFAVGNATADGSQMVYHSNLASMGSKTDLNKQGSAQGMTLNMMMGAGGGRIIAPTDYRFDNDGTNSVRSTTFGVRDSGTGHWRFYSQRYQVEGIGPQTVKFRELKTFG